MIRQSKKPGRYQSDKYNQKTATSLDTTGPITVTVVETKATTFTVDQKKPDTFKLVFDEKLAAAPDVKVTNVISDTFKLNEYVKDIKLEDDGVTVTVTMFNGLANGFKYLIEVPEFEAYTLTASASEPVVMEIFIIGSEVPVAVVEKDTKIGFNLYDVEGVDVTDLYKDKGSILFDAEYSADYQLSYDGTLYFYETNKLANVTAEFKLDGQDANGNDYAALPKRNLQVLSIAKPTVSIDKLSEVKIGGQDAKVVTMLAGATGAANYNTQITFKVNLKSSDNAKVEPVAFSGAVGDAVDTYGNLYVQVADNSVLDVDPTTLKIIPYRAGSTNIFFKVGKDADSARIIDYITVQVRDVATFTTLQPAASEVEVATVGVDTSAELGVNAYTQYNNEAYTFTDAEIAGATFAGKSDKDVYVDGLFALSADGKKIIVDGSKITVPAGSTTARYMYTFKIANKSFDFRVTFKTTLDDSKDRVELVLTDGAFGDITRSKTSDDKDKAEAEKFATFTAYVINNSVKKDYVELDKYVADAATGSGYYVNVLKDGKPVTKEAYVDATGATVTISFNDVKDGNVTYPAGTGSFVVELYKGTEDGKGTRVYRSASFSTSKTDKAYNLVKQVEDSVDAGYTDVMLKECFEFTNTEGKAIQGTNAAAVDNFTVSTIASGNSVHVVSFTFYDKVEDGVFVPYTVAVGRTLVIE